MEVRPGPVDVVVRAIDAVSANSCEGGGGGAWPCSVGIRFGTCLGAGAGLLGSSEENGFFSDSGGTAGEKDSPSGGRRSPSVMLTRWPRCPRPSWDDKTANRL